MDKHKRMLKSLAWMAIIGSFVLYIAYETNQFYERLDAIIVATVVSLIYYVYKIYFKKE